MTCLRFLSSAFVLAICLPAVSSVPLTGGSGAEKADHRLESRRHEGIPSVAVDPKSGRLWCTWYGGITPNEDCNNYLVLSTSIDGGRTWKEVLHYDPDGAGRLRAFDCELWVAPDGTLRWFWTERRVLLRDEPTPDGKPSDAGWWAGHSDSAAIRTDRLMMMTLAADCEPVAPFPVPVEVTRGVMMCKPIVAKNGDWVLPVSRWFEDNSAGLVFSSDGGRTFAWHGGADSPNPGRTFDEHCVVEMPDGGFRIWFRNNRSPMESTTADAGRTWSATTNANFKGPATRIVVRRLKSGRILLVGHGAIDENPGRSKLTAFLSEDDGASWKGGLLLDERENSSYPDADEDPDGTIYVVWDNDRCVKREIRCARFTEADVLAGKMVKEKSETGLQVSVAPEGTYTVFNPLPAGSVAVRGKLAECVSTACSCDWLPSVVRRLMRKGDVSAGETLEAAIQDGEKLSPDAVNSLWMATPEGGLAAIAYASCLVRAKTNAGETEIEMLMDVPREGDITLRFVKGTGYFPVVTRMPSWCDHPRAGQFVKHARNWKPGMEIVIKRATFGAAQSHAYPEQCRKFPRYIAAAARKKQPKVVFLGDSITHHWRDTGRVQWDKYLDNDMYRPANLGVCGDRTSEVLWRIEDGCLDGYEANCVVLMIGTNNSGHFRQKPDDTAAGIKEILRRIHEKQPKATIILCAIFPRGRKPADSLRRLNDEVNRRIRAFADGKTVKWLDIGDKLLTEDGELLPSIAPDFLHPAASGYETWFAALKPLLDAELANLPPLAGDGVQDDTAAIQARLDSGAACVYLPPPEKWYRISRTLRIGSDTELRLDRFSVIRLAPGSDCPMIENKGYVDGDDRRIALTGGIWDMANVDQSPNPQQYRRCKPPREGGLPPKHENDFFFGMVMRFSHVEWMTVKGVTVRNPTSYGMAFCHMSYFLIDDITFDYKTCNPIFLNMDGVHLDGWCHHGRISNLRGTCFDDLVALNANDGQCAQEEGDIADVDIDGVYADYCHSAVRLLSTGANLKRVTIRNVHGNFYTYAVGLTHFFGERKTRGVFDDIVISDVFMGKVFSPENIGVHSRTNFPPIWVEGAVDVGNLTISNFNRDERNIPVSTIRVDAPATIGRLTVRDCKVVNRLKEPLSFFDIHGKVGKLVSENNTFIASPGEVRDVK